jgi:hypothetical protein
MSVLSISGVVGALRRVIHHADGNVSGQAYGLTMFAPIHAGQAPALQRHLQELPTGDASALARLPQLHCSRLHVLQELVYQGEPQERESLQSAWLIFTASFDGELDAFLREICAELPAEADAIFNHCVGYPGTREPSEFIRYVKQSQVHNHYFLTPYPDATVQEVRDSLALRQRLTEFAINSQGLDAVDLQQRFGETFGA